MPSLSLFLFTCSISRKACESFTYAEILVHYASKKSLALIAAGSTSGNNHIKSSTTGSPPGTVQTRTTQGSGVVQGTTPAAATAAEALLRSLTDVNQIKSTTHYIIAPVDQSSNGKRHSTGNAPTNGNGNGSIVSTSGDAMVKDNTPGVRDIDLNLVRF